MHVIAPRTVRQFASRRKDAREPLEAWLDAAEKAQWTSIDDVRRVFPSADSVKMDSGRDVVVFNIKGNSYRLIVAIHFNRDCIYILRFLTHAEYDKDHWKRQL